MKLIQPIIANRHIAAIVLLWLFGGLMIIIFVLPQKRVSIFGKQLSPNEMIEYEKSISIVSSEIKNAKQLDMSNAFVFVNINKKNFLTRFVSIIGEEKISGNADTASGSSKLKQDVTTVRKIKPVKSITNNNADDNGFSIKPVPR
jgi:hypothetical protein